MMLNFVLVAIGGGLGAMLRYGIHLLSIRFAGEGFPWGTLTANGLGCLAMGILIGIGLQKNSESIWLLVAVGILGGLTTFSTFSGDTLQLSIDGQWLTALGNVLANLFVSLGLCAFGLWLARVLP